MACPKCESMDTRRVEDGFFENENVCNRCGSGFTSAGSGVKRLAIGVAVTVLTGGLGAVLLPIFWGGDGGGDA